MKVDAKSKHIAYNDEAHKYWNTNSGEQYISATTLIGKYKQPFDKEFWSAYKAVEKIMKSQFQLYKKKVGKDNVATKFAEGGIIKGLSPSAHQSLLREEIAVILDEWQEKADVACARGTIFHKEKEDYWNSKNSHVIEAHNYDTAKTNVLQDLKDGVYSELLIYNDEYKIAGQADLVIKKGKFITIRDYKTNKEIKEKSYMNPRTRKSVKMLSPLQLIDDCNYQHYTLQLSLYGWMIEQLGDFRVVGLYIDHVDHNGKEKEYKLKYKKQSIIKMLNDYKTK